MKCILFLANALFTLSVYAQEHVIWSVSHDVKSNEVVLEAQIDEGWHLYSQFIQNDIGPVPTQFVFDELQTIKWDGKVNESLPITMYDPNFEASLDFFKDKARFSRKLAKGSSGTISGYVNYMVCNDIMCLPPIDYNFKIVIQ